MTVSVTSFFQGPGLSQNKSLRTLEVLAHSVNYSLRASLQDPASSFLKHALSTITSPIFLEVVVIYRWYNFRGIRNLRFDAVRRPLCHICGLTEGERAEEALQYRRQFKVFREAQKVRDFQLVLRAEVWDDVGGCSVGISNTRKILYSLAALVNEALPR